VHKAGELMAIKRESTMLEHLEQEEYLSEKIRSQLKNLVLLLIGAIIFAFLTGMIANIIVAYLSGTVEPGLFLRVFLPCLVVAFILAYVLFVRYVFSPNSRINGSAVVPIIYDIDEATVIDDPFDGYYPQKLFWQAFSRFKKKYPQKVEEGLKSSIYQVLRTQQKHVLTELLEYAVMKHLCSELGMTERTMPWPHKLVEKLPRELGNSSFISFFNQLESTDIEDLSLKQIVLLLPKDVDFTYVSPAHIFKVRKSSRYQLPNSNAFQIVLAGKYVEISLTVFPISDSHITTLTSGPAPVFEGIYIREYWEKKISARLPNLRAMTFYIRIQARLRLKFGLFLNLSYIDWVQNWLNRFLVYGTFGGFDFREFRKIRADSLLQNLYEDVRETNMLVNKFAKD
jgi:hypothetical protein